MKPIELLKEAYKDILSTDKEIIVELRYDRYNAAKSFAVQAEVLTVAEVETMETKALIEWENSLTAGK